MTGRMFDDLHEKLVKADEEYDVHIGLQLASSIGYVFWDTLEKFRPKVLKLSDEAIIQFKEDLKSRVLEYIEDEDGQWLRD